MTMNAQIRRLALVALLVVPLSACSAAGAAEPSSVSGGAIEVAVSEACANVDAQCVLVNGQGVLAPTAFERADVEDAAVGEDGGQNVVNVTFSEAGAAVFNRLTDEAVHAGDSARLVMRIGGELRSAVRVTAALTGDQVQIILSADDDAHDVVDLLLGD